MKINIQLFAGAGVEVKIYSNDGNTLLYSSGDSSSSSIRSSAEIEITSTGVNIDNNNVYTYSGQNVFLGLSGEANSQILKYKPEDEFIIGESELYDYGRLNLYIVEGIPATYKQIKTTSNDKVQVESAIRDGDGFKISTNYVKKSEVGTAAALNSGENPGNVPILDYKGELSVSVLPDITITNTYSAANEAAMLALTVQKGDICVRTDLNKTFIVKASPASTLSNWQEFLTPPVNNSTITFTQGGTTKGTFTLNQSSDTTIALDAGGGGGTQVQANWNESDTNSPAYIQNKPTIPSTASDVGALSNSTKYGASLSVNGTSLQLKDQDGNNLGSAVTTQDTDTGATSVELKTGDTGNVVTAMTYDSGTRKITYEMGITALTSHQDIKTINNTSIVGSGNLDVKELFVCTYGTTTYAEITSALSNGKLPTCIYNDRLYTLASFTSSAYRFSSAQSDYIRYVTVNDSNVWAASAYNLELANNKVTSISSSSTDAQYPSAKCVYDLVGDIDTILTQLNSGQGV